MYPDGLRLLSDFFVEVSHPSDSNFGEQLFIRASPAYWSFALLILLGAIMRKSHKTALILFGLGVFLIVGPLVQQTYFPYPSPSLPQGASRVARGAVEGSQAGSHAGSLLSMVIGFVLILAGVKKLLRGSDDAAVAVS